MLETDCAEAAQLIREGTSNTPAYAFRISVIQDLIRERGVQIGLVMIYRSWVELVVELSFGLGVFHRKFHELSLMMVILP
jgi:hypothetical protein